MHRGHDVWCTADITAEASQTAESCARGRKSAGSHAERGASQVLAMGGAPTLAFFRLCLEADAAAVPPPPLVLSGHAASLIPY